MSRLFLGVVTLSLAFSQSLSQQLVAQTVKIVDNELLACSAKSNSIERLACFDVLAKRLGPPKERVVDVKGDWMVSSETSKFDDTKSVFLSLQAKNKITGWPGKSALPSLMIRCKERKTDAYINFGMSPTVEYGLYDGATIQLRIDKQPPFKVVGSKSTDGEALFFRDPVAFSKRLFNGTELLVRFVPFNSSAQETSFNISGLEAVIGPLRETCKWPK